MDPNPKSSLQPELDHIEHAHPPPNRRAHPLRGALTRIARIMRLLIIGYPSEDAQLELDVEPELPSHHPLD